MKTETSVCANMVRVFRYGSCKMENGGMTSWRVSIKRNGKMNASSDQIKEPGGGWRQRTFRQIL